LRVKALRTSTFVYYTLIKRYIKTSKPAEHINVDSACQEIKAEVVGDFEIKA